MATITLGGNVAEELFSTAARRKAKESGPISQREKQWARWAFVAEHFGEHEITVDLDDVYLMLTAGAKQKNE